MIVDKILIPNIISNEQFLLNYSDVKELKLNYAKVRKVKNYYLCYTLEPEKTLDAYYFYFLVKLFYGQTLFYFIERNEDKFYVFGGHTFELNETTFFYKEINLDEIDEIKEIDIINRKLFNTDKSIVFFININNDAKRYILDLLDAKEGNNKRIFSFVFIGDNFLIKYRAFILSFITIAIMYYTANYFHNKIAVEVNDEQTKIISAYQHKIEEIQKRIDNYQEEIKKYYIGDNVKIYLPKKNKKEK